MTDFTAINKTQNEYPTINPEDYKINVYWEPFFGSYVAHLDDPEHDFERHAYAQGTTPEMALAGLRDFLDELEGDATDEGDEWP